MSVWRKGSLKNLLLSLESGGTLSFQSSQVSFSSYPILHSFSFSNPFSGCRELSFSYNGFTNTMTNSSADPDARLFLTCGRTSKAFQGMLGGATVVVRYLILLFFVAIDES